MVPIIMGVVLVPALVVLLSIGCLGSLASLLVK